MDLSVMPLGPMILGIVVAFVVAYASIAWLLRFLANNSLMAFVIYRIVAGALLLGAVGAGWISAT